MTPTLEILKQNLSKFPVDFNSMSTECTLYPNLNKEGYGEFQFRHDGIKYNIRAHRAVYSIFHHDRLKTEDIIMHTCDNPGCVNILHLKKGTHDTNVQDRVNKNRSAVGEKNGRYVHGKQTKQEKAKPKQDSKFKMGNILSKRTLTNEQARKIKNYLKSNPNHSVSKTAKLFNVSRFRISDIKRGQAYANVL